jgi:hypothetical protein
VNVGRQIGEDRLRGEVVRLLLCTGQHAYGLPWSSVCGILKASPQSAIAVACCEKRLVRLRRHADMRNESRQLRASHLPKVIAHVPQVSSTDGFGAIGRKAAQAADMASCLTAKIHGRRCR